MNFINKKFVTGLIIGAVVGGIVMGFIDANRPTPLFSSASLGICEDIQAQINFWWDFLEANPKMPDEDYEHYQQLILDLENVGRLAGCPVRPIID